LNLFRKQYIKNSKLEDIVKGFGLTEAESHHFPRKTGAKTTENLNQDGQSMCQEPKCQPEHKDKLFTIHQ
jgi:hypothetical protein